MPETLILSDDARRIAGILLLAIVTIESGGVFMLRVLAGSVPTTDFQKSFYRAGHAHAGVLVTLALVVQLFADAAQMDGAAATLARSGVPAAAILMPAGFFFSAMGRGRTRPNRFVYLLYAGAAVLAAGVIALGLGLLLG